MNREEIDEMMRHLPSQQPKKSAWEWALSGSWIAMFVILCIFAPQISYQPTKENDHGNQLLTSGARIPEPGGCAGNGAR